MDISKHGRKKMPQKNHTLVDQKECEDDPTLTWKQYIKDDSESKKSNLSETPI